METITQELRSQVCLGPGPGLAAVTAGDGNFVEFYADLGDNNSRTAPGTDVFRPDRFRLTYDPAAKTVVEQVYQGAGTPPYSMTFTLRRTRTLLQNVDLVSGKPFFRYFAFTGTEPIAPEPPAPGAAQQRRPRPRRPDRRLLRRPAQQRLAAPTGAPPGSRTTSTSARRTRPTPNGARNASDHRARPRVRTRLGRPRRASP